MNTTDDPSSIVRLPGQEADRDAALRAEAAKHLRAAYDTILQINEFSIRDRLRMMGLGDGSRSRTRGCTDFGDVVRARACGR